MLDTHDFIRGIAKVMNEQKVPFDQIGISLPPVAFYGVQDKFREHIIDEKLSDATFNMRCFGYKFTINKL